MVPVQAEKIHNLFTILGALLGILIVAGLFALALFPSWPLDAINWLWENVISWIPAFNGR